MSRLAAFEFVATHDGEIRLVTFYATTHAKALAMASTWGKARGWTLEERKA